MNFSELNSLSGKEFEELIYKIIIDMGFRANFTKATGDGGIDIEADFDGPVFAGKYLIQCKRWNNSVGEPVIRDFYGAVISANALKGILITTSSFTNNAYQFASGKNLELIDQVGLARLTNLEDDLLKKDTSGFGFINNPEFDRETYEVLKNRINYEPQNLKLQELIISFLSKSLLSTGKIGINNGLFNELENRIETYIKVIGSKKQDEAKARIYCVKWISAMCKFAKGDILQCYELIKQLRSTSIKWILRRKNHQYCLDQRGTHNRMLYVLFDLMDFNRSKV